MEVTPGLNIKDLSISTSHSPTASRYMAPAAAATMTARAATRGGGYPHGGGGGAFALSLHDDEADDSFDTDDADTVVTRDRRSSSVESALSIVGEDLAHSAGMTGGCCRGYNARLLFLMGCAAIEYVAHTVVLVLGPMIALHFYPTTSYPRLGFYAAILSASGYLGSMLSCKLWINIARSLKSAKGVILWGLAILGSGFLSLLLCQSLLAMAIVRFAMGLFSGVIPVALIEIDNICGNRQTRLAVATKYVGILVGAGVTFLLVGLGDKLFTITATEHDDSALYFYPFCFVSVLSWVALVVMLIGLRMQSRKSYVALTNEGDPYHKPQRRSALDDSPTGSSSSGSPSIAANSLSKVKSAFEETFRRTKNPLKKLLLEPRPHFRTIRSILPHFYHGYTESGHVVIWDFLGQVKMDKLTSGGFTTLDIRAHYQFFLQFALEKLVKSSSQKIVYVVDLEGLTLTDTDDRVIEHAGTIIEELQKSFPDKLVDLAVINAPVWFSQVMASLKPRIAKRTLDKIRFFSKDQAAQELLDLLGVDSLPKKYGGRNGVEFGKSSQERALGDHLRQTTGLLEETKEIISGARGARAGSLRSDGDSDEEAFFDCSEYGLQDAFDDDDDISIVVHSQSAPQHGTSELVARGTLSPTKPGARTPADKKVHDMEMGTSIAEAKRKSQASSSSQSSDVSSNELAITREPHACLILAVFFFWSLVQVGFDEILPLWFFRKHPTDVGTVHAAAVDSSATISSKTMHLAVSLATMAFTYLLGQLVLCRSSSSVMTPLATLRLGLLFQIPAVGAFPLLNLFHLDTMHFASVLVVVLVLLKHVTAVIALHGLMALLDNSIAVDRRLVAHRAAHVVSYVACLISGGGAPALFALLGYFAKSFPLDQSLLYFVQALGLVFLFLFSFLIPSRLNFPMLFAMSKR